jgi:4-amino-4-deoxy-L-arabinose transferase-like glycosyltransferase
MALISEKHEARSFAHLLWVVLIAFIMIFGRLGALPLISPDEGRNAEVAREMMESGSWLVPTYNGLAYLDKPAFYFKTVALSFSLFGVSEASARLSSAFCGFSLLAVAFLWVRREYGRTTALLAVAVLATTPLFVAFSRIVIFDMTLALFVCSAVFAGYLAGTGGEQDRRRWSLAAMTLMSLATLVKGPVGFVVPLLVLGVFNWLDARKGVTRSLLSPLNLLLFVAIVGPWFAGVSIRHPDFPYYGLVKESLARFGTAEFKRTQPPYYYVAIIAACFLPWSILLPEALVSAWRARSRWTSADRLLIVWASVVVVFFSLSQSKLPGYILSGVVALGILTARVFATALNSPGGRIESLVMRATLVLTVLCAGFSLLVISQDFLQPEVLQARLKLSEAQSFAVPPVLKGLMASLALVAVLAMAARFKRDVRVAFVAFAALPLSLLTANFQVLETFASGKSARALAEHFPSLPEGTEIACLSCYPNGLSFYLQRPVSVFSETGSEFTSNYIIFSLRSNAQWPDRVIPVKQRRQWLTERRGPVFLMAETVGLQEIRNLASAYGVAPQPLYGRFWGVLLPAPGGVN